MWQELEEKGMGWRASAAAARRVQQSSSKHQQHKRETGRGAEVRQRAESESMRVCVCVVSPGTLGEGGKVPYLEEGGRCGRYMDFDPARS